MWLKVSKIKSSSWDEKAKLDGKTKLLKTHSFITDGETKLSKNHI